MTFSEIDGLRKKLNVSQYELCRAAGINPSTYTRLLSGQAKVPHPRTLRRLKGALELFRNESVGAQP